MNSVRILLAWFVLCSFAIAADIDTNLRRYYTLDTDGTDVDESQNATPSGSPTDVSGMFGNAQKFVQASSQRYDVPDITLDEYTVGAWVRRDGTWQNLGGYVTFDNTPSSPRHNINLMQSASSSTNFYYTEFRANGTGGAPGTQPSASDVTQWNHLVAVKNGATVTLYVNGDVSGTTVTVNDSSQTYANGRIGCHWTGSNVRYSNSNVDEYRIYDAALSETLIEKLAGQHQVLYYSCDNADVVGTELTNTSGFYGWDCDLGFDTLVEITGAVNGATKTGVVNGGDVYGPLSVIIPTVVASHRNRCSITFWFNSDNFGDGGFTVFHDTDSAIIQWDDDGYFEVSVNASSEYTTNFAADSRWHHCAITYDGTDTRVYIDGQLRGTETYSLYMGDFSLGSLQTTYGTMGIDEVEVYGEVLSGANILARYEAVYPPAKNPPSLTGNLGGNLEGNIQ